MSLPRLQQATHIADQLNMLTATVKTRSRASLTDANRLLETIAARFFNALFGWDLVNLNTEQANYPAADLGDRGHRIAIQVTNEDGSDKIMHTATKAIEHKLGTDFDRLIVFFLLPRKPALPKKFIQPPSGPKVETWDIADLLKQLQDLPDLDALARAAKVLDEEMGKIAAPGTGRQFDISRILKYAPAELIGRDEEMKLLHAAWSGHGPSAVGERPCSTSTSDFAVRTSAFHPRVLTFVALGGEGKTSLVAKWVAELAGQDWPGCDAAFAWSFYSQGTREQQAASSDLFLKEALTFFGDEAMAGSAAGAYEKGRRLAQLVGERRALLILDGLEPLQYAPSSTAFPPGQLKDQGVAALLKGLAAASHGLCVVTTRYSLPDLKAFWQTTAPEVKLLCLSRDAGVHLLKTLGVTGTAKEFEALVEAVKGHALTLTLLGGFLKRAFHGDIRQRDRVKFEKADEKMDGGHAFRTMAAYEQWLLRDGGDEGRREVAVLRLMGLFDRPADAGCLAALRRETIPGLTEPLAGLADDDWEYCLSGLEAAKLLTVNRDASGALISLDAQPLLREYFARQLRAQQPEAWRAAHRRLYEHLCASTPTTPQTHGDVDLLCRAVIHASLAELFEQAWATYRNRVEGDPSASFSHKFGTWASALSALAGFFGPPWSAFKKGIPKALQAYILNQVGHKLQALGRLGEAVTPKRMSLDTFEQLNNWEEAAIASFRLADLHLYIGEIAKSREIAERGVADAERRSTLHPGLWLTRSRVGNALHQMGRMADAEGVFLKAEDLQRQTERSRYLHSGHGYLFCDLLLDQGKYSEVEERAQVMLELSFAKQIGLVSEAFSRLAWGRALLLKSTSQASKLLESGIMIQWAVKVLKDANAEDERPRFLLALAEYHFLNEQYTEASHDIADAMFSATRSGMLFFVSECQVFRARLRFQIGDVNGAQADLDEAWEISARGPMRLHMADIHLYRARLFFREKKYPWDSPAADLAAAEKLINECGYHRRDEELADAKRAILGT